MNLLSIIPSKYYAIGAIFVALGSAYYMYHSKPMSDLKEANTELLKTVEENRVTAVTTEMESNLTEIVSTMPQQSTLIDEIEIVELHSELDSLKSMVEFNDSTLIIRY